MRIDTGNYTGDANATQTINLTNCIGDLSAVTSVVIVVPYEDTDYGYWTTDNFDADFAKKMSANSNHTEDKITTLGAGSFVVEGLLNTNGADYCYLVLQYDGSTTDIETGNYTGNGNDDQDGLLTYGAWTPDGVLLGTTDGSEKIISRAKDIAGDLSGIWKAAQAANLIQSVNSGYCQLGSTADVNENGMDFQFFVIGEDAGYMEFETWAGDNNDPRNIVCLGSDTPDFVFITHTHSDSHPVKEIGTDGVDTSHAFYGPARTDRIQDFIATGIELGNDAEVNSIGNSYYLWAFKKHAVGVAGVAPTGALDGPLVGCLGGPV